MEEFLKQHFFDLLNLVVIPLFYWVWKSDRKLIVLEKEVEFYKLTHSGHADMFQELFKKLNEIKDVIHSNFVSQKTCDFRHK